MVFAADEYYLSVQMIWPSLQVQPFEREPDSCGVGYSGAINHG